MILGKVNSVCPHAGLKRSAAPDFVARQKTSGAALRSARRVVLLRDHTSTNLSTLESILAKQHPCAAAQPGAHTRTFGLLVALRDAAGLVVDDAVVLGGD